MLMVTPVGPTRAAYHRRGPPGTWVGSGAAALRLAGAVDIDDLTAVLGGRHPATGEPVAATRSRRRAGFEVVVAAPKSVSLLAAAAPEGWGAVVEAAHRRAATAALGWLDGHAARARRGTGRGLTAAVFAHGANAAGEPHLHVHAVVLNLVASDNGWAPLQSRKLWHHRQAADAVYQLALRHELDRSGLRLEWHTGPAGGFDVAGVPRRAVEAASSRRARILAITAPAANQSPAMDQPAIERRPLTTITASPASSARAREIARRQTRADPPAPPWQIRVRDAGFTPEVATTVVNTALQRRAHAPPPHLAAEAVERELVRRGSRFRPEDVPAVLARLSPSGMPLAAVEGRVVEICGGARPGGGGTFVCRAAAEADHAVTGAALARVGSGAGVATATFETARQPAAALGRQGEAAVRRLVGAGHGVEILGAGAMPAGRSPLIEQAAVIDAACRAWEAAGHTVAVVGDPAAVLRWRNLTGLETPERTIRPPTVLIVDRADRLATPALGALLAGAEDRAAKVILVEGGTAPARPPRSAVLERLGETIGTAVPCRGHQPPVLANTVERWWRAGGEQALMVAAGPAEVDALNTLARRRLAASTTVPATVATVADLSVYPGARLVALQRGTVPAGTRGTVATVDPALRRARVIWDTGASQALDRHSARVGHGYAITPALVRAGPAPMVVLGDNLQLGQYSGRVVATERPRRLPTRREPAVVRQRDHHRDTGLGLS